MMIRLVLIVVTTLPGCAGYVPGRQSYWDAEVRRLCSMDGGVQILQQVRLSKSEIGLLETIGGEVDVPNRRIAHPQAPLYSDLTVTTLKSEGSISIWRAESVIKERRSDSIVARWVVYTRSGGDIPSPAHGSSYVCPDPTQITKDLQRLFIVSEEAR